MKKILSLVMVVAMLVAVLALVGCNNTNKPADTTAADTTAADTTAADTTAADTTAADTTTAAESTTLPPVFARFDFGEKSYAQDLGMTSHEYLKKALTIDSAFIGVEYTADSIIVTAVQNHPEITFTTKVDKKGNPYQAEDPNGYAVTSYALCFEDLVTYDFDDELKKDKNFLRIRIKNNTTNNIMAFRWHKAGQDYATTLLATCMYLQGGAPTVDDYVAGEHKLVAAEADTEFKVYTYDINFLAFMGRENANDRTPGKSYVHMAYYAGLGGSTGSNNWNWMGTESIAALEFFVLGAFGGAASCAGFEYGDTRANIKAGDSVEIDYIIFGAKADLNSFVSYDESAYNYSVSVSKSASISASEAAAATATTAA